MPTWRISSYATLTVAEMPFQDEIGGVVNCGFCRTAVWEFMHKNSAKIAGKKTSEGSCSDPKLETAKSSHSEEVTGEKPDSSKVCAQPNAVEHFKALFSGPQFVVDDTYFNRVGTSAHSLFERHVQKVRKAFKERLNSASRDKYVEAFSSANWEALPQSEKSCHSLSNCVACATQFEQLQKMFPLKPFFCPPLHGKENMPPEAIDAATVRQATGVPFTELAANLGYKSTDKIAKIAKKAEEKGFCEGQQKCIGEISSHLENATLPALYSNDVSFNKFDRLRKAQYFDLPSEAKSPKRKHKALQPHECENYGELCQNLKDWDPTRKFVGTELARTFKVAGTDAGHKIKLLAQKDYPAIPGLEIASKQKSTRVKFTGTPRSLYACTTMLMP